MLSAALPCEWPPIIESLSQGGSAWVGTVAAVLLPAAALLFGSGVFGLMGALRKKLRLA